MTAADVRRTEHRRAGRQVDRVPAHGPEDRIQRGEHARVHRLHAEHRRGNPHHVRHAAEGGRAVLVDQRAQPVPHRAQVEQRAEHRRPHRAPPGPPEHHQPAAERADRQAPGTGSPGKCGGRYRGGRGHGLAAHQSIRVRPVRCRKTSSRLDRRTSSVHRLKPGPVHAREELVAVAHVEQQTVGGNFHPFGRKVFDLLHDVLPGSRVLLCPGREPQLKDFRGGVAGDEVARGAFRGDLAVVHDDQAVAQLLRLVHVVRGEDERDAALLEVEQAVPDDVPCLRVEPGGGLVEYQDVRVVDEAPGDREAALHAAGQRLYLVIGPLGELHEVEQLGGALVDQLARQAEVAAVDEQVLPDRQLVVQRVFLRHDAESRPDRNPVAHRIAAQNGKLTICRRRNTAEHAHGGGFPGPVRAKEAERLTTEKIKVDPVHSGEAAEPLR